MKKQSITVTDQLHHIKVGRLVVAEVIRTSAISYALNFLVPVGEYRQGHPGKAAAYNEAKRVLRLRYPKLDESQVRADLIEANIVSNRLSIQNNPHADL